MSGFWEGKRGEKKKMKRERGKIRCEFGEKRVCDRKLNFAVNEVEIGKMVGPRSPCFHSTLKLSAILQHDTHACLKKMIDVL